MQGVHLRKYGVQATIDFEVYEVDGVNLRTNWSPAQADCEIMKDGGTSTQCDNTATDEGSTYSIVLTATEMQAARLILKVVDAAAKVFLDKVVVIETYGNAAAQHAMDFDNTVPTTAQIKTEIEQAGSHLALIKAITDILFGFETTISAVQTADTVFDMASGIPNIDDYNNMVVAINDISSGFWVVRKVVDYDQANFRITIDRDTGFPLAVNDLIKFSNLSYTPTVAGGGGATAQEVHEFDVSSITTPGQAGFEIQQRGSHLSR